MALSPEQITKIKQYISVYDSTLLSNPNVDFIISDSADMLSPSCFGKQYEKAIAFVTMHTLTVASQTTHAGGASGDATGGSVIQKTIGPITIKWANPSETSSSKYLEMYKTTKYGLMFLDLLKICTLGLGISITDDGGCL